MFIASFLKTEGGDFDIPAFALLIGLLLAGGYGLLILMPTAIRTRRIRFTNCGPYGFRGSEFLFERDKNPIGFWIMIVLFSFTYAAMIVFGVLISFGIQRSW